MAKQFYNMILADSDEKPFHAKVLIVTLQLFIIVGISLVSLMFSFSC